MSTAITQKIEALGPWFHNLHLPDGTQTAPDHFLGDFPNYKWHEISQFLPEDMRGMKALNIGCKASYYTFQLAIRGAVVTAVDIDEHCLKQARWAADDLELSSQIEFRQGAV